MTEQRNNSIFIGLIAITGLLLVIVIGQNLRTVPVSAPLPFEKAETPQPQNVIGLPQDTARLKAELERKGIKPHPAAHWKALGDTQ